MMIEDVVEMTSVEEDAIEMTSVVLVIVLLIAVVIVGGLLIVVVTVGALDVVAVLEVVHRYSRHAEEGHLLGPIEVTGMTTIEEDLLKDTGVEGIELLRMIIVEVEEATKIGVATEMIIPS